MNHRFRMVHQNRTRGTERGNGLLIKMMRKKASLGVFRVERETHCRRSPQTLRCVCRQAYSNAKFQLSLAKFLPRNGTPPDQDRASTLSMRKSPTPLGTAKPHRFHRQWAAGDQIAGRSESPILVSRQERRPDAPVCRCRQLNLVQDPGQSH